MSKVCEVAGRRLGFRQQSGRSPVLICLHGSGDNQHGYDRLVAAMPEQSMIALSAPGRLDSEGPPLGSVAELAALVRAFVDSEVSGDYVVVGHSLGGAVAIEHALAEPPKRLRGIVLLATGARLRVNAAILALFAKLAAAGEASDVDLMPAFLRTTVEPSIVDEVAEKLRQTPSASGLADWSACNAFDRMGDLHAIGVPALVVSGSADPLTPPKYGEYLHAHIGTSELVMIEGAGHLLPVTHAIEVGHAIERFLDVHARD